MSFSHSEPLCALITDLDCFLEVVLPKSGWSTLFVLNAEMDIATPKRPEAKAKTRLRGIVNSYISKKLPIEKHPSFKAIRAADEDAPENQQVIISPVSPVAGTSTSPTTSLQRPPEAEHTIVVGGTNSVEADDDWLHDEAFRDVEREKQTLTAAIAKYEATTKGSKYRTGIDLSKATSWEDVVAEVQQAGELYKEASGPLSKIRKVFGKLGNHTDALNGWFELLPSGSEYFSILCGGLKLVVGAAARLKDLDDATLIALIDIPSQLLSTQEVVGIFRASDRLKKCAADLFVAVLAALQDMVIYYRERAAKKLLKTLIMQDSYQSRLEDKLKAVGVQAKRFAEVATTCHYRTSKDTNSQVRALREEFQEKRRQDAETIAYMRDLLERFLSSNERVDYRTQDVRDPIIPLRRTASEAALLKERARSRKMLLDALDYEESTTVTDVASNLRIVWQAPKDVQDRVIAIMGDRKLQQWVTSPSSAALFINGNYPSARRISPTSFICAKFVDSVQGSSCNTRRNSDNKIILSFFCTSHQHPKDPDAGPAGVMRNLIAQLLLSYKDFELATVRQLRSLDYDSVEDLCDIFEMLIAQLPLDYILFIVIDSISVFDNDRMQLKEAEILVETLAVMANGDDEDTCVLKVLLTSTWNSKALSGLMVQKEDVLWMPHKVASQGGFTMAKLDAGMGRMVLSPGNTER